MAQIVFATVEYRELGEAPLWLLYIGPGLDSIARQSAKDNLPEEVSVPQQVSLPWQETIKRMADDLGNYSVLEGIINYARKPDEARYLYSARSRDLFA